MKKTTAFLLALLLVLGLSAGSQPARAEAAVMSYADYAAAELDTEVTVETYVQAKQSWWEDKATFYCQSEDGAYFLYNMPCSEEEYELLVPGTRIRVTGYKSEWAGEVEITDAVFEILEAEPFLAEAEDVTALLGDDALIEHQNRLVAFKGMTVEPYDESGAAFAYKNPENKTDDLYFKLSKDGETYEFCVEYYLCNEETQVYQAVEALNVGDCIDLEAFLYWYEGPNPHVIAVAPAAEEAQAEAVSYRYKNGTYTGTGRGMGGNITVTITIENDVITVDEITGPYETPGVGGKEAIEDGSFKAQIEAAQNAEIESVAGATMTSGGVRKAVQDALSQARA